MNRKNCMKHVSRLALGLAALVLAATPSFAQTYDLCATTGTVSIGAENIPIWGYVLGSTCAPGTATIPGPVLRATEGDTVTINLTNNLSVPVSVIAPGYNFGPSGPNPGALATEAGAGGGTATYTFTAKAGTYLYHSGSDINTQVPMGLYGALVVDVASNWAYADVDYDQDEVLVYSEIDPNLNADPAGFGGARVINWSPQYFLINGEAQPSTAALAVDTSADVLLRFVNAGLRTFFPTLDGGLYMDLKAEDGNRYPQPLQQYGIELQAGKTVDAMINAGSDGAYALYDRGASYNSGVTEIVAGAAIGAPTAVDDSYTVAEDGSLTADGVVPNPAGVLDNDSAGGGPGPMIAILVSNVSSGALVLNADGTFDYTPSADFSGNDQFSYVANDGGPNSNVATVTITVTPENDAPVAVADAYDAEEGSTLNVAAPGVLGNDTDIDGDSLTAVLDTAPTGATTFSLNSDGSFSYEPSGTAGSSDSFTYHANDGLVDSNVVTVTLTVVPAADNIAPFANDDYSTASKNSSGITFSVTANDVDADGTIDVTTVVITTGPYTQRGGTVVENNDGTVTYVPKRGFRGTDTFQYEVNDNDGATSNVATVRINVS